MCAWAPEWQDLDLISRALVDHITEAKLAFNLRFKTDAGPLGPPRGKPVIVGAGMDGVRTSVVFATPGEISGFIKESCE